MKSSVLAGVMGLCLAAAAQAETVSVEFTGLVDEGSTFEWAAAGSTFTGRFSFDTDLVPELEPMEFPEGTWIASYTLSSFEFDFGAGHVVSAGMSRGVVIDNALDPEGDAIFFEGSQLTQGDVTHDFGMVSMTLVRPLDGIVTTTLPTTYKTGDFSVQAFGEVIVGDEEDAPSFKYQVTSISNATAVPEMSSAWMALVGMAGLAGVVRARRARSAA